MKRINNIGRRDFLKMVGVSATAASLPSCLSKPAKTEFAPDETEITGDMTYRTNSSTGDKVSILGYGCMRFPTRPGSDDLDQEAINRLIDHALANGVNYFDTAPVYCKGDSERATGEALSRHPRDSYYIATKMSNFGPDTWSAEKSKSIYRNSLKQLRTDYIDYMLLHGIGMGGMDAFNGRFIDNGILNFLKAERDAGRIRNLGFSYHGDIEVFDHLLEMHDKGECHWDFAQIQLNYIDWEHAKEINKRNTNAEYLYGELEKRGISAVVMEPILGGRLAKVNDGVLSRMKQRRPHDSAARWAFRYAGSKPGILTVLSGMTYMEHLQDNLSTYSPLESLEEDDYEFLDRMASLILEYPTVPCTDCKYCMPCPYGLNIPAIFAHYNKCLNDGNITADTCDPRYAEARRAFLVGYDRSVPKLRQADHCIACHQCEVHCPQGIHIADEMSKIDRYVEKVKQQPEKA